MQPAQAQILRRHLAFLLVSLAAASVLSCIFRGAGTTSPSATLGGCTICHVDVADELAGALHQKKAGIACVTCHGHSKGHVQDENNEVKPDRVFARHQIDPLCDGCHFESCHHAETNKRLPAGTKRRTCADCHGAHTARIPPKPKAGQ